MEKLLEETLTIRLVDGEEITFTEEQSERPLYDVYKSYRIGVEIFEIYSYDGFGYTSIAFRSSNIICMEYFDGRVCT